MTLATKDWEGIIKRHQLVGGDLEIRTGPKLYRGPIKEVRVLEGGECQFSLGWWARFYYYKDPVWEYCPNLNPELDVDYPPLIHADGRIEFVNDSKDIGIIYPQSLSRLKPNRVIGLPASYITEEVREEPRTILKFHDIEFAIAQEVIRRFSLYFDGVSLHKNPFVRVDNQGDPLGEGYCMVEIYGADKKILSLIVVAGNLLETVLRQIIDMERRLSKSRGKLLTLLRFWKWREKDLTKFLA